MKLAYGLLFCLVLSTLALIGNNETRTETGKASFYAKKFHKRKTASGIAYNKDEMVCAHPIHPFGTKLVVKNPKNNKKVVVEVIDRGPFKKGRVVDLSYAAAKELDIIRQGIAVVEVSEYMVSDSTVMANDSIETIVADSVVQLDKLRAIR